jgi:hypothetical protein
VSEDNKTDPDKTETNQRESKVRRSNAPLAISLKPSQASSDA